MSFAIGIQLLSTTIAQENETLGMLVQLAPRKGYKNTNLGDLCTALKLAGRAEDGNCRGFQLPWSWDFPAQATKYGFSQKTVPSFNTFVERGAGVLRIILVVHDEKNGYAFLVDANGKLQKAMTVTGRKQSNGWHWSATAFTPNDATTLSNLTKLFVDFTKDVEDWPDRKD
jgi:hypothetical protein